MSLKKIIDACALALTAVTAAGAEGPLIEYSLSTGLNAGTGDFAPYFIASNSGGIFTQPAAAFERISGMKHTDSSRRFDYGFGLDLLAGVSSDTDYKRWDPAVSGWKNNPQGPANIWIQQLYGEIKYRSLFLTAGMKTSDRSIIDGPLSSGDYTLSDNARPIPQIRAGFLDFVNFPWTNGWLQIRGEAAYGKFLDNNWLRNHFNRKNFYVTTGTYFHHASIYFRSNPEKRLVGTFGMQHAAQFGGTRHVWSDGKELYSEKADVKLSTIFKTLIPIENGGGSTEGDQNYYEGNHLGCWDFLLTYTFDNGSRLTAAMQHPWDDGSGIGFKNGFDGIYALQYDFAPGKPISAIRAEYLDFRNQSGPIHWAPGDHPGTNIHGQATGGDNYYNNFHYNGWANYGMSLGTPFMRSPIYNTDGFLQFLDNRVFGFHAGAMGRIGRVDWRVLYTWRKALGTYSRPRLKKAESTSMLFEAGYDMACVKGLSLDMKAAFDAGSYFGGKFGVYLGITYTGNLKL